MRMYCSTSCCSIVLTKSVYFSFLGLSIFNIIFHHAHNNCFSIVTQYGCVVDNNNCPFMLF